MDITNIWRRTILSCRGGSGGDHHLLLGSGGGGSSGTSTHRNQIHLADPLTQQALEVLDSIKSREDVLDRCRDDYIDAFRYVPSRASKMTDQERDQIDQVMASFIIKCGSQIEIIRCALSETTSQDAAGRSSSQGSRIAHCAALVAYLAERLQDLSHSLQSMQAQRRQIGGIAASKRRLYGPVTSSSPMPSSSTALRGGISLLSSSTQKPPPKKNVMSQSQLEIEEEEAFSRRLEASKGEEGQRKARQALLEKENNVLTVQLHNEFEDVRVMEGKMVELSQLLGLFTGKLMEQQDQVEQIYESALGTNTNVEQATNELVTTLERNSKASQTMLTFVCLLCLGLLLLDQLVP